MPNIVDESDLEPATEEDLQTVSQEAATRRAAILKAPLPETQAPPIWNKKSRAGVRFVTGVALPSIAAAPFTGGASLVAGALGAMGAEGLDYAMSPEEERPTLLGGGVRTAATLAVPYGFGKVAGKLAPLAQKLPEAVKIPLGPAKEAVSAVGGKLVAAVGKAGGFAAKAGERTEESELRSLLLKELEHYSPGIHAVDVAELFRTWFDPKKALPAGLDAVRKQFVTFGDDIIEEAKAAGGVLPLTRVEELLHNFSSEAFKGVPKRAAREASNTLRQLIANHIGKIHGDPAKADYLRLTNAIRTRLDVAEGLGEIMRKNPITAVQRILAHPDGKGALQAFDQMNGTAFLPIAEKLDQQIKAVSAAKIAGSAGRAARATLREAQNTARNFLKGVIVTAAAAGGAIGGSSMGGVGGAVMGSTSLGGIMLSLMAGRAKGAIPLEKLATGTAKGLAVAARPVTTTVGQTAKALFGRKEPQPETAPESDLLPEEQP